MTVIPGLGPVRLALAAALALSAVGLVGCTPWWSSYRIDVQQGNNIDATAVGRLKLGMTRDQVRFVLGTPLVTDVFHVDRWDYVYHRQRTATAPIEARRLTAFFNADRLERVEGEGFPDDVLARIAASGAGSAGGEGMPAVSGGGR
jgi:outer membrane protein assembly factor BamE